MRCPYCKSAETRVVDSRDSADNSLRRRRSCSRCGKRFTTYERVEQLALLIIKKDGTREPYQREKLRAGIVRACVKLPISSAAIDAMVSRLEQRLLESRRGEVSSHDVGELVMGELRKLNTVAYIRFAAVYREFADIADFESELGKLLKKTKQKTRGRR